MRVMAENPMGRQRSGWRYKLYRAGRGIRRNWGLYLLLLPAVVLLFCFNYLPMYGVQIAFRDFSPSQGIQGSPWVGLANFQKFFNSFQSKNLIWNTVSLSLYSLVAGFPFPIILALMVNQIRVKRFKQVLQVVTYLPHFISTVVMVGIMLILLSPSNGIYGNLARSTSWERRAPFSTSMCGVMCGNTQVGTALSTLRRWQRWIPLCTRRQRWMVPARSNGCGTLMCLS